MNLLDCLTTPTISKKWGDSIPSQTGELYFRDNGSSVLAVAHLDFVMALKPIKHGSTVWAPQLDDRLGAWVLLNLFPSMGINVDVLLTDLEESACSTAQHFSPYKEYNWIIEFDRHGNDVVMYDYECEEYVKMIEMYDVEVGFGSFSDICHLEHLDVAGFNFGTGYYREHTKNCYANLKTTKSQVIKFKKFYDDYKDVLLVAPEEPAWETLESEPTSNRPVKSSKYATGVWGDNYYRYLGDDNTTSTTEPNNNRMVIHSDELTWQEYDKAEYLAEFYGYINDETPDLDDAVEAFLEAGGFSLINDVQIDNEMCEMDKMYENFH